MCTSESSTVRDAILNPNAMPPSSFQTLMCDSDAFLSHIKVPTADNFQFSIEGVLFRVSHKMENGKPHLYVWAILGYLPYSVVSQQKRRILLDILACANGLPVAKFGLDAKNKLVVSGSFITNKIDPAGFIFEPLVLFLQEALPYIRLIGDVL